VPDVPCENELPRSLCSAGSDARPFCIRNLERDPRFAVRLCTTTEPRIAIAISVPGAASAYARPALDGARLALEEANAAAQGPAELSVYDDRSDPESARQVIATDALAVVGQATTAMSLAAGPLYAEAGLVSIGTTATGDGVTANATTFQASFTTGDGGEALANYLRHALNSTRAVVV
jgi:branched-chain amino acid transport system substrate-binding protein